MARYGDGDEPNSRAPTSEARPETGWVGALPAPTRGSSSSWLSHSDNCLLGDVAAPILLKKLEPSYFRG